MFLMVCQDPAIVYYAIKTDVYQCFLLATYGQVILKACTL